jgi:transcriptional regulator with XRE-family HTH domain
MVDQPLDVVNISLYCAFMTQNGTPAETVARRVRELRKSYGWSAERLANEMTKAGIAWDRSIVANLENGRRRSVDVGELLALGFVLNCPPLLLLAPIGHDVEITVRPGVTVNPYELVDFLTGDRRLPAPDLPRGTAQGGLAQWKHAVEPLRIQRRTAEVAAYVAGKQQDLREARRAEDEQAARLAEARVADGFAEMAEGLKEIEEAGMVPPPGLRKRIDAAREAGYLPADGEA